MVIELDSQFDKRKQNIKKIVNTFIQENNIDISETAIENLVIHLSLCVARELNGTYIPTSESQIDHLKKHKYYIIAKDIIMALNNEFDIDIDKNQMSYTTMYLANINLLDIDFNCNFDLCDEDMEDVIDETIVTIKKELHLDLRKNKEFYTGMTLHFYPALDRLQNDQQLTDNPLKDQIQDQHQVEFACAQILNKIVEQHYNKAFNEHEIAYIALHFGTAFRK